MRRQICMYHFDARDYDPVTGRWTTLDPARQHWSGYQGMGNNPVMKVDPDGRVDGWVVAKGTVAVVTGSMQVTGATGLATTGIGAVVVPALMVDGAGRVGGGLMQIAAGLIDNPMILDANNLPTNLLGAIGAIIDGKQGGKTQNLLQLTNDAASVMFNATAGVKALSEVASKVTKAGIIGSVFYDFYDFSNTLQSMKPKAPVPAPNPESSSKKKN